jgi:hypothetical protein
MSEQAYMRAATAHMRTHSSSWRRAYEDALQHRAAPRRPSPPNSYSGAYIPALPERPRLRTQPAKAHVPRDDGFCRSHRRPQSTASVSGSTVLRELVISDPDGPLLHGAAPSRVARTW